MKNILHLSVLVIFSCSGVDDSSYNNNNPSNCDIVYLDSNGITIKACPDANIWDVGEINGVQYTVVNRAVLDDMKE